MRIVFHSASAREEEEAVVLAVERASATQPLRIGVDHNHLLFCTFFKLTLKRQTDGQTDRQTPNIANFYCVLNMRFRTTCVKLATSRYGCSSDRKGRLEGVQLLRRLAAVVLKRATLKSLS